MKHFLNSQMLAPNVMTVAVDDSIVQEFADLDLDDPRLNLVSPSGWHSDIGWYSAADELLFDRFQSAFDRLGIAAHVEDYVDLDRAVRLYAGFLVARSSCAKAHFHVDWIDANNDAFTFITPLCGNDENSGLLYRRLDGGVGRYQYKRGEGIVFGDKFEHSTQPGTSDQRVILLCFEFGTDKMEHWPHIRTTIEGQTAYLKQPNGEVSRPQPVAVDASRDR